MAVDALTRPRIGTLEVVFAAAVLAEVGYPLTSGPARDAVTMVTVLLVAAAVHLHAWCCYGARVTGVLAVVTVAGGFAVETIGVHTGFPFGSYRYTGGLGPSVVGVPLVVAFAWPMLAWPAALVARRLCRGMAARVLIGAWALAAWDVFLDPQMVAAGHWRWADPQPHLPGVPAVPLTNYAGWFAIAVLVSLALQVALQASPHADDRLPLAFYVWTWASSTLALGVFLDLAGAAVWGALAMGAVAGPLLRTVRR
jgi:putative membrane protein